MGSRKHLCIPSLQRTDIPQQRCQCVERCLPVLREPGSSEQWLPPVEKRQNPGAVQRRHVFPFEPLNDTYLAPRHYSFDSRCCISVAALSWHLQRVSLHQSTCTVTDPSAPTHWTLVPMNRQQCGGRQMPIGTGDEKTACCPPAKPHKVEQIAIQSKVIKLKGS